MASHHIRRAASALPLLRCRLPTASAASPSSSLSARLPQLAGFPHTTRGYQATAAYSAGMPGVADQPQEIEWDVNLANHVSLIGHLGQDPQIRVLPGGKEVVSLNLAVNRKQKGEDVTDWYSIDCWEQTALQAKTYMAKGMQICVQGRVRIDAWDDKDTGKPRSAPKVTANTLYTVRSSGFPDARPQAAAYAAADPASYQDQAAYASQEYAAPSAPTGGGGGGGAKSPKDELWSSVLEQPQLWWDNRLNKKNPKAPDFKQKDGGYEAEALWLNSSDTPAWVHQKLNQPGGGGQGGAPAAATDYSAAPLAGNWQNDPPF